MTLTSVVLREKQLDLCEGNIIRSHVDCFCLQEKSNMKPEVFALPILRRPPQQFAKNE